MEDALLSRLARGPTPGLDTAPSLARKARRWLLLRSESPRTSTWSGSCGGTSAPPGRLPGWHQ